MAIMVEPYEAEEQFEGDDLYDTLSSEQINDTHLGSSPVKSSSSALPDSGVEDFVFATQASIEEDLSLPGSASPSLTSRVRARKSTAKLTPPIASQVGKTQSSMSNSSDHQTSSPPFSILEDAPPSQRAGSSRRVTPPSPSRHPYKGLELPTSPSKKRSTPSPKPLVTIQKSTFVEGSRPARNTRKTKWSAQLPKDMAIDLTLEEMLGPLVAEAGPSRKIPPIESKVEPKQTQPVEPAPVIELSQEQRKVLNLVLSGESLFFTGSAGTGKSVLLREIIKHLSAIDVEDAEGKKVKKKVAITASTGIAGVNIGGQTLHSWAGLGLAVDDVQTCANRVIRQDKEKKIGRADPNLETPLDRWLKTDVLIVDEMSMIDGRLWDKLESVGRVLRKDTRPFGGIQLVLCGDFFQLPPVPDRHDKSSVFAFEAQSWPQCVPRIIKLKQVFRQSNQRFVDMLTEARLGQLSGKSIRGFACLARPIKYEDGINATELFPTKRQSDLANESQLKRLGGETRMFVSIDKEGIKPNGDSFSHQEAVFVLDKHSRAPAVLDLRIGAQVMLIVNMPNDGLCNGSVGKVVAFETVLEERQRIQEELAKEQAKQKAEESSKSTTHSFAKQASEALLNVLAQVTEAKPGPPEKAVIGKTYRHDADLAKNKWPIVEFTTGQRKMMIPVDFDVNSQKGVLEAKRIQVPLILAWALSIHKAQGITLPRLKVDLAKTFEKGQAYVALSRATSLETLEVNNFRAASVLAHPKVIEWAKCLEEV